MVNNYDGPWTNNWIVKASLGGGGQSTTHMVVSRADGNYGVLKVLKQQQDLQRRARMHKEVAALEFLATSITPNAVPTVLGSNCFKHADLSVRLYFVMEYVDALTLAKTVDASALNRQDAIDFGVSLFSILEQVHAKSHVHRDLKPNNVMLRNGSPKSACLIDFGLTFNTDDFEVPRLTPHNEQVGNRFLALPEFQIDGGLKNDPRSDITQASGLVFYSLTGEFPRSLQDENGRLPHQRTTKLTLDKLDPLLLFFDRAFATNIGQRWQSAADAGRALESALALTISVPPDELLIDSIKEVLASDPARQDNLRAIKAAGSASLAIRKAVIAFSREIGRGNLNYSNRSIDTNELAQTITMETALVLTDGSNTEFVPKWIIAVAGSELTISLLEFNGHAVVVFRGPTDQGIDETSLRELVFRALANGLHQLLRNN